MRLKILTENRDVTLNYDNVVSLCDEFGWTETKDFSSDGALIFVKGNDRLEFCFSPKNSYTFTVFKSSTTFVNYYGVSLKELKCDLQGVDNLKFKGF